MRLLRALWLLPFAACGTSGSTPPPASEVTYHGDVRGLLESSCVGCHQPGGIGPFRLDDLASAREFASVALVSMRARTMPPWMPSETCRPLADSRRLEDAQIERFARWVEAGLPEGDPSSYVAAAATADPLGALGAPSAVLSSSVAYAPSAERSDDYRCFPLSLEVSRESFLRAVDVVPGDRKTVHHVLLFLVSPELSDDLRALDEAEAGPGYTCFGGPGLGVPQTIAGWVPGAVPTIMPADTAVRLSPGARLVLQVHYNTTAGRDPDRTQARVWVDEQKPTNLVVTRPLANLGIELPANQSDIVQTKTFVNRTRRPWKVVGLTPHMHMLGTAISARHVPKTGEARCLVDIPRWDFNWQQRYLFRGSDSVSVLPGEAVEVQCKYDNSPEHQAIVNGVRRTPRDVTWGEGTLDEMCLVYIMTVEPYAPMAEPPAGGPCPGFDACYSACVGSANAVRTGCMLQCASQVGTACTQCVFQSVADCTLETCPRQLDGFQGCVEPCQDQADPAACVRNECVAPLLSFDRCSGPVISTPTCARRTASCGVTL